MGNLGNEWPFILYVIIILIYSSIQPKYHWIWFPVVLPTICYNWFKNNQGGGTWTLGNFGSLFIEIVEMHKDMCYKLTKLMMTKITNTYCVTHVDVQLPRLVIPCLPWWISLERNPLCPTNYPTDDKIERHLLWFRISMYQQPMTSGAPFTNMD